MKRSGSTCSPARASRSSTDRSSRSQPATSSAFPRPRWRTCCAIPGSEDLVYLAGGENREFEVAEFPTLGKRMVRMGQQVDIYDVDDAKAFGPL